MDANPFCQAAAEQLAARPWRQHPTRLVNPPPTMLMRTEIDLLHWLTSRYYQGRGLIVDAGCFLGGSTHALASGLAVNPAAAGKRKLIHSYDLFSTAGVLWYDFMRQYNLGPDQSFEDRFRRNIAEHAELIEVHAGNLLDQSWGEEPVEILFLDICKLPPLHDHATRMWFPRLIPGRSILIQQDYGWWNYYWGNIVMEVYRDRFAVLDDVPVASRVYLCTHEITEAEAAERLYARLADDDKLRHMAAAVESVKPDSRFREHLWLNSAMLARSLGRTDLAERALTEIFTAPAPGPAAAAARQHFPHFQPPAAEHPASTDIRVEPPHPPLTQRNRLGSRLSRWVNRLRRFVAGR